MGLENISFCFHLQKYFFWRHYIWRGSRMTCEVKALGKKGSILIFFFHGEVKKVHQLNSDLKRGFGNWASYHFVKLRMNSNQFSLVFPFDVSNKRNALIELFNNLTNLGGNFFAVTKIEEEFKGRCGLHCDFKRLGNWETGWKISPFIVTLISSRLFFSSTLFLVVVTISLF